MGTESGTRSQGVVGGEAGTVTRSQGNQGRLGQGKARCAWDRRSQAGEGHTAHSPQNLE